jgi:hypothetical protein
VVRVLYVVIALGGLAAAVANKHFATASQRSSAKYFGRVIRPGSGEQRFMVAFSRGLTIVVGTAMFVGGILGAFGLIWQD